MTTNPYVGPRSFKTGEALHGRDWEISTLLDLLIAERIVLMHSPSGAGKTSLLRAGLLPQLRKENFNILPMIRVNLDPPPGAETANRYILSTLLSLEEGQPPEKRFSISRLVTLSLDSYLDERLAASPDTGDPILVFDQFEEILTVSASDREGKHAFFAQLGEALRNKKRWALFSMREDYLGAISTYSRAIPNRLATRFRLDLLGEKAAIQAMREPARALGVDFTPSAAQKLVDDLRRVKVQLPDGSMESQPGPYVEPVQLQVVCFRLWEGKAPDDMDIDEHDLASVGDVNQSLAEYYALSVSRVAQASDVSERSIREWFEHKLITPDGIRGQVRMGAELSDGLPNPAVRKLEDAHIIRAEQRAGQSWYELSHDRLIEPVRADNRGWFSVHLSLFQQQAVLWSQQGKSDGLLLRGKELEKAEDETKSLTMTADEQAFLEACRKLREREQRDRRQRQFIIAGLVASLVLLVVAIFFGFSANAATQDAKEKAAVAQTSQADAEVAKSEAESAKSTAVSNEKDAQLQKANAETASRRALSGQLALASISVLEQYPQRAQLLALEALQVNLDAREPTTAIAEEALRAANAKVNGYGLPGFSREVSFLEFTRDNQWLMAGSWYSGEFHAWNIAEMNQPGYRFFQAIVPPPLEGETIHYFSDQQTWFVVDRGIDTHLWQMSTLKAGAEPLVFEGSVIFLADDQALLEQKPDQTVLWRFNSQKMPEKTPFVLDGKYTNIQPDLTTVITTTVDGQVLAWDTTKTPPQSSSFKGQPTPASPESGQQASSPTEVPLADVWESIPRRGFEDPSVISATSSDQQWHAEGAYGGSLRLWNLVEEQKFQVGEDVSRLEFSADGKWMISGANLWQLKDGLPVGLPIEYSPVAVYDAVFSPDGRWLLYMGSGMQLLDLSQPIGNLASSSLFIDLTLLGPDKAWYLVFSPGSRWLVASGGENTGLWNLDEPQTGPVVLPEKSLSDVAFTPGDEYIVGLKTSIGPNYWDKNAPPIGSDVWIWEVSPQSSQVTQIGELKIDLPAQVSANGIWLIAQKGGVNSDGYYQANADGELWDLRCVIQNTPCDPFPITGIAEPPDTSGGLALEFSPDSRYLTSYLPYNWSTPSPFRILDLQEASGQNKVAPRLVYDATAKYLSAMPIWNTVQKITRMIYLFGGGGGGGGGEPGSYKVDYGIQLFEPSAETTSLQSLILRGHEEPVDTRLTSPSGRWTVTISQDSVKLWDLTTLQDDPFAAPVNLPLEYSSSNFGFSMDERWLVFLISQTDSDLSRLVFVPLQLDTLMTQACQSVGRNFIINEWQRYFQGALYHETCANLPEHQSVQILLQPTPTATVPAPTATTASDNGFTSTPGPTATPTLEPGSVMVTYTVKNGDTLISIANRLNTDLDTLMRENNITNPDLIAIGQVIIHKATVTPTP